MQTQMHQSSTNNVQECKQIKNANTKRRTKWGWP